MPDSTTPQVQRTRGFSPSVIEGSLGRVRPVTTGETIVDPVMVPVMGRIAAGTPIEAIQTHSHSIVVPPDLLSPGEHFALEVRGDSMIEAGIFEGDTVLIRRTDTAETGDIVVALVDEEEATLKAASPQGRLDRPRGGEHRLRDAFSGRPRSRFRAAGRPHPPLLTGGMNGLAGRVDRRLDPELQVGPCRPRQAEERLRPAFRQASRSMTVAVSGTRRRHSVKSTTVAIRQSSAESGGLQADRDRGAVGQRGDAADRVAGNAGREVVVDASRIGVGPQPVSRRESRCLCAPITL